MKKIGVITLATMGVLVGCEQKKETTIERNQRLEEKRAAREANEKKDLSSAMSTYIKGKCELAEAEVKSKETKVAELKADATKLSLALDKIMGAETEYSQGVLKVLGDAEVNKMAVKYLLTSFQAQKMELKKKIEEFEGVQRSYQDALTANDRLFATNTVLLRSSGKDKEEMMRERNEREKARLERDIKELERNLKSSRGSMHGSRLIESDREEKQRQYIQELNEKKKLLNQLNNPVQLQRIEAQALEHNARELKAETLDWQRNKEKIEKTLKPKFAISEIAKSIETVTISKLQTAFATEVEKRNAELEAAKKRYARLKDMLLLVPVSNASELRSLKEQAEKL